MTLVLGHCHCRSPDVVDLVPPSMSAWCSDCGRDIHRDTLERLRDDHEARRAAAESEARDLLYSLGAP